MFAQTRFSVGINMGGGHGYYQPAPYENRYNIIVTALIATTIVTTTAGVGLTGIAIAMITGAGDSNETTGAETDSETAEPEFI